LTCRSWYIVVVPHHTLTLRAVIHNPTDDKLEPLSHLHKLGLSPLVREIRVVQRWGVDYLLRQRHSTEPPRLALLFRFRERSHSGTSRSGNPSLHAGIERYLKHFSLTLRSLSLVNAYCTPRQLFPLPKILVYWTTAGINREMKAIARGIADRSGTGIIGDIAADGLAWYSKLRTNGVSAVTKPTSGRRTYYEHLLNGRNSRDSVKNPSTGLVGGVMKLGFSIARNHVRNAKVALGE